MQTAPCTPNSEKTAFLGYNSEDFSIKSQSGSIDKTKTQISLSEGMALIVCHEWNSEVLCHPWGVGRGCWAGWEQGGTWCCCLCTLVQHSQQSGLHAPPGAKWLSSRHPGHTGAGRLSHRTPNKMFGVCRGLSAAALTSNSFCFPAGRCPARALP